MTRSDRVASGANVADSMGTMLLTKFTMFLGAADNLVTAIQAGVIERDAAVDRLVALFAPLVPAASGMRQ